ncbi:MAG TPA: hypothetical protein VIG40_05660, partial [Tissierellaceae bacterium]
MKLLNGDYKGKVLHIGANDGQKMDITIQSMTSDKIGKVEGSEYKSLQALVADVDKMTQETIDKVTKSTELKPGKITAGVIGEEGTGVMAQIGADEAIKVIDEAVKAVSGERSKLGSVQN